MEEQVVVQANLQPEAADDVASFVARYPFPLDAFQLEAIAHLAGGQSVMVAAPTGTGKTMVAEYAIWRAQQRGQRVIYTTPLKALSNQKYRDLRVLYGESAVGLVTGDIVERSSASIVIMTTEVYRNMLLEESGDRSEDSELAVPSELADVGYIIFDELHFLSDVGRGPVWEEAIICSPPHIGLVGLSATVSNAEDLADWISRVHRPIALVVHEERAVPLEHYYFLDGKLHLVQDADGNRIEHFPNVGGEARIAMMKGRNRVYSFGDDEDEDDGGVVGPNGNVGMPLVGVRSPQSALKEDINETEARERRKAQRPVERKTPTPGEVLTALRDADMLPCLYFLPGRKVVEEAAIGAALHRFTSPEEEEQIREEVAVWLTQLPHEDRNLRQAHTLSELLPRGIAYHHAGLLPGLKVLVETLFARGHLRAVFATDTLALGVNMPARAVVVGSLSKFDGQEMRLLTPNEYRQLTGRAGRRGMDVRGAAVIPYSPWEQFEESFQRITAELLPVTSSFIIRYNSVLNLWRPGDVKHLRRICASSLREYQRYVLWERRELARLEKLEARVQKAKKGKDKLSKKKGATSAMAIEALEKRRQKIGAHPLSRAGAAELDGTIYALRVLGYIDEREQLTLKGRLLRNIFHPAGIFIVEMLTRGVLDNLSAGELAEVCSWFTFDHDRRLHNQNTLNGNVTQVRRELWHITQHIRAIEDKASISPSPGIVPDFHGVALAWSRGMSLSGLLRRIDLAEGDLLMLLNQTIDLLQQVQSAVGQALDARDFWTEVEVETEVKHKKKRASELQLYREHLERLRPVLAQASASLLRGIIIQSRTLPSMVARVGNEEIPLDAVEDIDPQDDIDM
jgi:ATP-dependent RNA helicase HelY